MAAPPPEIPTYFALLVPDVREQLSEYYGMAEGATTSEFFKSLRDAAEASEKELKEGKRNAANSEARNLRAEETKKKLGAHVKRLQGVKKFIYK